MTAALKITRRSVGLSHMFPTEFQAASRAKSPLAPIAPGAISALATAPHVRPDPSAGLRRDQPLLVIRPRLEQLMDQHQDLVPHRHQRLLLPHPLRPPPISRPEDRLLGV